MAQRLKHVSETAIRRLIKYEGPCCNTCHVDNWDYDYDMCFISDSKGREAEVCCAVYVAFEKWKTERKKS